MLNFRQKFVNFKVLGCQFGQAHIVLYALREIRRSNSSRSWIYEITLSDAPRSFNDRLDRGEELLCQAIRREIAL